ncbi:MAG: alanine dehydrogenase [Armatimonadetes bacterium]|nr:alanine dehydrogenase [Armatimonadota bacterium]
MIVGVPKETKENEYRVGLVPVGAELLRQAGHTVLVEADAGWGTSIADDEYRAAGAEIVNDHAALFERAEMLVKVKEPLPEEYGLLRRGQVVFTYFHLAASEMLTRAMIKSGIVAIAYETIQTASGTLPCLVPMSEVAGRMAIQEGAKCLERPQQGRGILLGGVPGVSPANVLILGAGVVGSNAAKVAAGFGARVTVLDIDLAKLRYLDDVMPANVTTLFSNPHNIRQALRDADLLIGAVLIRGARAPVLVTREMLRLMKPGAAVVDVAVDQGGCIETIRPTTHRNPTYIEEGVVHYAVANIPGAVAGTSTYALTNVTLPYVLRLASQGYRRASLESAEIASGLNLIEGHVVFEDVARQFGVPYVPPERVLGTVEESGPRSPGKAEPARR